MAGDHGGDGWDAFDWSAIPDSPSTNGHSQLTHGAHPAEGFAHLASGMGDERRSTEEEGHPTEARRGQWVSRGGILDWDTGDEDAHEEGSGGLRAEAGSHWAEDEVDLPPGAPDTLRIRAARAWIVRQRMLETEAQGILLLERRHEQGEDVTTQASSDAPLEIALSEHQGAIEAYDSLLAALEDLTAHTGPSRVLVEFYFWLNEQLASLAAAPEAPAELAERLLLTPMAAPASTVAPQTPSTPRSVAEWQGRMEAMLQARRRVEYVSAPEPED